MKKHLPLIVFLILYFLYVFLSYKSFGYTWDEQAVYDRGKTLYQHLISPNFPTDISLIIKQSSADVWPLYNNAYAMMLYSFNQNEYYARNHLYNLLFASLIFIAGYYFLYKKYNKPWFALLAPLFIVLNPRFFGDIAANPKDMPFAVLYFVSVASMYFVAPLESTLLRVLILGVLFGLTQGIRVIGFTLFILLFLYDLLRYFTFPKGSHAATFTRFLIHEAMYVLVIFIYSNFVMLLTWPYIGSNYFKNFVDVLRSSQDFPWTGGVLFLGKMYTGGNIPISYLPVWLMISTPVFILLSAIGSVVLFMKKFKTNEPLFLVVAALCINLLFYFILRPVVYNGVRHFLFLLPLLSLLAAIVLTEIVGSTHTKLKIAVIGLVCINAVTVVRAQAQLFPYQYVYFNEFVGGFKGASRNFDTDYWAAATKQSLEWVRTYTKAKKKTYTIYSCGLPLTMLHYFNMDMVWADSPDKADFAVCSASQPDYKSLSGNVIYTVSRDGVPLSYVFALRK